MPLPCLADAAALRKREFQTQNGWMYRNKKQMRINQSEKIINHSPSGLFHLEFQTLFHTSSEIVGLGNKVSGISGNDRGGKGTHQRRSHHREMIPRHTETLDIIPHQLLPSTRSQIRPVVNKPVH